MRAFVAVEVPGREGEGAGATASAPEHLTLRFLGEIDSGLVDRLIERLGPALARIARFEFVLDGVGAFPSPHRPRVVWRGVTEGAGELHALARAVREVVDSGGASEDATPFVPHMTLFRVRSSRDRERAARLLAPQATLPPPTRVPVTSVQFVESRLSASGAHHEVRARFPLAGAGP